MKGVNVFDVLIHNKNIELLRIPNDYLWRRNMAKTQKERDELLQEANLKFFTVQQEIYSLSDLNERLFNQEEED